MPACPPEAPAPVAAAMVFGRAPSGRFRKGLRVPPFYQLDCWPFRIRIRGCLASSSRPQRQQSSRTEGPRVGTGSDLLGLHERSLSGEASVLVGLGPALSPDQVPDTGSEPPTREAPPGRTAGNPVPEHARSLEGGRPLCSPPHIVLLTL